MPGTDLTSRSPNRGTGSNQRPGPDWASYAQTSPGKDKWRKHGNSLSGQSLLPGQSLQSDNGLYTLTMQSDGNVVLRNSGLRRCGGRAPAGTVHPRLHHANRWQPGTLRHLRPVHWDSKTQGNPGAFLDVQNDGNLVVYRAGSTRDRKIAMGIGQLRRLSPDRRRQWCNAQRRQRRPVPSPRAWSSPGCDRAASSRPRPSRALVVGPDGCGLNSVTVNAIITASWSNGSDATAWHWQDLQNAFATALWAVMQAAGNSQITRTTGIRKFPGGKPVGLLAGIPSSSTGDTTYPRRSELPPTTTTTTEPR